MGKIRILQFPIANSNGGITHYALNNWKHMNKMEFQCDFATMSKRLDFADDVLKTGSKIHYISCYAEQNEEQFIKEINEILDNEYDVVHLHTKQWKSYLIENICNRRHVPKVIVHSHSTRCDSNNDVIRERETYDHYRVRSTLNEDVATDYWACSSEAAEWLFGDRIPPNRIKIIPNAIETERFRFNIEWRRNNREKLGISDDVTVIGNVGRLVYPKNHSFLIEAFAKACVSDKSLLLIIVGGGEKYSELVDLANTLGIREKVVFLGYRDDVNELYSAMDVFALTSRFEGLPISAIEAQTSGLPVLLMDSISHETKVLDTTRFIAPNINCWKQELLEASNTHVNVHEKRSEAIEYIVKAGYDLDHQIIKIENEYRKAASERNDHNLERSRTLVKSASQRFKGGVENLTNRRNIHFRRCV